MFLEELKPIIEEGLKQPVTFLGGLASGLLRLDLEQEPIKSWLEQQLGKNPTSSGTPANGNTNNSGPQSIAID